MKKWLCVVGFFLCSLLVGCGEKEVQSDEVSPEIVKNNSTETITVEKEGYYQDKNNTCSIEVQKLNENSATVVYYHAYLEPCLLEAKKNPRGEYRFTFSSEELDQYAQVDFYSAYSSTSTPSPVLQDMMVENAYDVSFRFEDNKILVNIKIPKLIAKRYCLEAGVRELKLQDKGGISK